MRLIIHPGHAKCGSTTIQQFLAKNRRYLYANRVLIADTEFRMPSDNDFEWEAETPRGFFERVVREDKFELLEKRIKAIGSSSDFDIFIISAENLPNHLDGNGRRIYEIFTTHFTDIQIIYYIKPQDTFLMSAWQQWGYKTGISLHNNIIKAIANGLPNYCDIVKKLETIFTKEAIRVIPLSKHVLREGDLLKDFVFACNIDLSNIDYTQNAANKSMSLILCETLGQNPELFKDIHDESIKDMLVKFTNDNDLLYTRFDEMLTLEDREEVLSHFLLDNQYLHENYFSHVKFSNVFSAQKSFDNKISEKEYYQKFILLLIRNIIEKEKEY